MSIIPNTIEDGYVKFVQKWQKKAISLPPEVDKLMAWRNRLYQAGLIGMYQNGIGFGNVSMRCSNGFIISGNATGGTYPLTSEGFTEVYEWSRQNNSVNCRGPVAASSESLTHAALYEAHSKTLAVYHIHSETMWSKYYAISPTTAPEISYGTPAMAEAIVKVAQSSPESFIVMGGHREGIVAWGEDLDAPGNDLLCRLGDTPFIREQ